MIDHTLPPYSALVTGMTGTGKTGFVLSYLFNAPGVVCRFIYDDELGSTARRLNVRPSSTEHGLNQALASRLTIFNPMPAVAYGTPPKKVFRDWCKWVVGRCAAGPGKKIVLVDEVWKYCNPDAIPYEFAMLSQEGRKLNVELLTATQHPERVNASLTGAATELVCFRLGEPDGLRCLAKLGVDAKAVAALPLGTFISYNRLSGGTLKGKLF